MVPAVRARGLFKVFGRRPAAAVDRLREGASLADVRRTGASPAVIDVDLQVEPGEIFVVMGLSGSGKSTLIRMLNGLLEPTAGTVHVGGDELTGLDDRGLRKLRQERMSMVFQHFALLPHRSVLDNAAYALEVRGVDRRERHRTAREALERVGLGQRADSSPAQLSGGMQQRVGLARALAAGTDLMLMDEAFSALDPLIRREMQDELLGLQRELGKTIVFITHDLNEAMRLGDRVMVMRDGRVVQVGAPQEILDSPADDYVAQFLADVDRGRVFTAADVMTPFVGDVHAEAQRVGATTPVADLLQLAAQSTHPLLVVDGAGPPVGRITASDLLAALSGAAGTGRGLAAGDHDRSTEKEGSRG
ncbi:glycine betaine/L-proline ABC transporter ATP-binding protein [Kineococcus sp. TRM81007]|uniref:quaternary amine ABC transporter ATP-binding protein n=1 Tax=Kineococcus sp. TRM81007 TaxID=2925831 RepID=UPI0035A91535